MKTLSAGIIGALTTLLATAAVLYCIADVDIKIFPKFQNIFVFGSHNTVNPKIDSQASPTPQPTVQAQATPAPVEVPKNPPVVKGPDKTENVIDSPAAAPKPENKTILAKAKPYLKPARHSNGYTYYPPVSNDGDATEDCECPGGTEPVEASLKTIDAGDNDQRFVLKVRPGVVNHFSRMEQRQVTVVNGRRTVKRTVTTNNNGEVTTDVYDN